mmetsp:Transcript_20507/g.41330  ORF Transcript_20507/g.41330 Transcript_20507/m.41330 type:complete len:212 (-) Transcript_20507:217-852(-)
MPLKNVNGLEISNLNLLHVSKCAYDYNDGKHKYIDASCDTQASGSSRGGKELLAYTRAIVLKDEELRKLMPAFEGKSYLGPVSIANEMRTLKLIRETAVAALNRFETTYEEDMKILRDEKRAPKFGWYRNAVLARSGEKSTLIYYRHLAETMIPLLGCSSIKEIRAHTSYKKLQAASKKENFGYYAGRYFEHVVQPLIVNKNTSKRANGRR